jgi:hypothetical protein
MCSLEYVDLGSVKIKVLNESGVVYADRSLGAGNQFKFDRGAVIGLMGGRPGPVPVTFEVSGDIKDGGNTVCTFSGTDTITWDPSGKNGNGNDQTQDIAPPTTDDTSDLPDWLDYFLTKPSAPTETPVVTPTETPTPTATASDETTASDSTDAVDQSDQTEQVEQTDVDPTPTGTIDIDSDTDESQVTETDEQGTTSEEIESQPESSDEPTSTTTDTAETTP